MTWVLSAAFAVHPGEMNPLLSGSGLRVHRMGRGATLGDFDVTHRTSCPLVVKNRRRDADGLT